MVTIQINDQDVNLDLAETSGSFFDAYGDLYLPAETFIFSGTVSAGSQYQYDITDKMYIRTSFPESVTVTVNGERVDFQKVGWRYVIIVGEDIPKPGTSASSATQPVYVSIQIGDQDVNLDLAETSGSFFDANGDLYLPAETFFFSGTVSAGSRYQYDVTDKMYIRTSFPESVTVTVNGERVAFQKIGWRYVIIIDASV